MKQYLFPLFFLITFFSEELFYGYMCLANMAAESGMLQKLYIVIASLSYLLFIRDVVSKKYSIKQFKFVLILVGVLFLFFITGLIYGWWLHDFVTVVLYFGSVVIPFCIIGMHALLINCWDRIFKLLPFFLVVIILLIGGFGLKNALLSIIVENGDNGLNYQSISYYMAESFGYIAFLLLFIEDKTLFKLLSGIALIFCAAITLLSGGRGGFVLLIAYSFFTMCFFLFKKRGSKQKVMLLCFIAIAMVFAYNSIDLDSSIGFTRITEQLTEDDIRKEVWEKSFASFMSSPLWGHGIGSVFYVVGYRSHNLFTDQLVEIGLLGTIFFSIILVNCVLKLKNYKDVFSIFLLFVFIRAFVMLMFSGYWLNSAQLWLVMAVCFVMPRFTSHKTVNRRSGERGGTQRDVTSSF